jgi:hypothetical protein
MKSFQPLDDGPAAMELTPSVGIDRGALGDELKSMFDTLISGPMPDRLLQLADALEEAFTRGDLFEPRSRLDS